MSFLEHLGFEKLEAGNTLILPQEKVIADNLNAARVLLSSALTNPMFGIL